MAWAQTALTCALAMLLSQSLLGNASLGITQMRRVGDLGVNQRMIQGLWDLGKRAEYHEVSAEQAREELLRLATETPRHPPWIVAVAVGCSLFRFWPFAGHGLVWGSSRFFRVYVRTISSPRIRCGLM